MVLSVSKSISFIREIEKRSSESSIIKQQIWSTIAIFLLLFTPITIGLSFFISLTLIYVVKNKLKEFIITFIKTAIIVFLIITVFIISTAIIVAVLA